MDIISKEVLAFVGVELKQCLGFGLPLAKGVCHVPEQVKLLNNGEVLAARFQDRGRWPDGSLRWLWCEAIVNESGTVDLALDIDRLGKQNGAENGEDSNWDVELNSDNKLGLFANLNGVDFASGFKLGAEIKFSGEGSKTLLSNLSIDSKLSGFYQQVGIRGQFPWQTSHLNFSCCIKNCEITKQSILEVRLHNPEAAVHPEGCWDLGDAASAYIESFAFTIQCEEATFLAKILDCASGEVHVPSANFSLSQCASGGEHWQSPIHFNADRELSVETNGFALQESEQNIVVGARAQPQLGVVSKSNSCAIELLDFWQNFPIQLKVDKTRAQWKLFSAPVELQGGESKTWRFCLAGLSSGDGQLPDLIKNKYSGRIQYNTKYFDECSCFPHLGLSHEHTSLRPLIDNALQGKFPFEEKRERIDMYGWRNWGDLYADHEAHGMQQEAYFASVYNNQYDPIMGMTLQYLHTGDSRWQELFKALSTHVQDIDIYDTEKDKAEYNGGLFWHTNHYLKMETCSHRSYSKHHSAAYENFSAGGGPGGQHCYTTGLMLQYRLFGDDNAKAKVEQLCNWIRCFYNGNGSLLDRTFRFLTIDIKASGISNIGIKAPGFRYPLDRGIGNFLVALMDCYEVTDKASLLAEVAEVIRNTCHPKEDLEQRNLLDVENAWFYTVFLQAVSRFTMLKHALGQHDADFLYARDCLLHYATWMMENEMFYLDRPETLEFPNDTWCAQDVRKATIYECASILISDQNLSKKFAECRDKTITYVADRLSESPEKEYTRILVLIMQSVFTLRLPGTLPDLVKLPSSHDFGNAPSHSLIRLVKVYLLDMLGLVTKLSVTREVRWFKLRFFKK